MISSGSTDLFQHPPASALPPCPPNACPSALNEPHLGPPNPTRRPQPPYLHPGRRPPPPTIRRLLPHRRPTSALLPTSRPQPPHSATWRPPNSSSSMTQTTSEPSGGTRALPVHLLPDTPPSCSIATPPPFLPLGHLARPGPRGPAGPNGPCQNFTTVLHVSAPIPAITSTPARHT